jgi:hypothetical protein
MKRYTLLTLLVAGCVIMPTSSVHANIRVEVPEDSPGFPFYARIVWPDIIHTDEWAVIPFYRDPSCVPGDFNLLGFIDIPRAFGCPLTVTGFEVWKNGLPIDQAPLVAKTYALGNVPVWFVAWPELDAAIADQVLTISELARLSGLDQGSKNLLV